jgi:hypothetical protein
MGGSMQSGQMNQAKQIPMLLTKGYEALRQQAAELGCNAVLGITFNVTNDSSGERGHHKVVIATVCGTPCVVVFTRDFVNEGKDEAVPAAAVMPMAQAVPVDPKA